MSVPLQSVPDDQEDSAEPRAIHSAAERDAAEIIASAHREAEAIVAASRQSGSSAPNPLAALGDNADEIIAQVRKLIKKQREMQTEREQMTAEIASLREERDELVQRLTDAVVRMEELAALADQTQSRPPMSAPPTMTATPPPPTAPRPNPFEAARRETASSEPEDTSLAARLRQAEEADRRATEEPEDSSLAARLERAEREREARAQEEAEEPRQPEPNSFDEDEFEERGGTVVVGADGRSFYDRHSAKLPRLEGDGGRSVLSAIGGMRPESEPKGRKGRRRNKK